MNEPALAAVRNAVDSAQAKEAEGQDASSDLISAMLDAREAGVSDEQIAEAAQLPVDRVRADISSEHSMRFGWDLMD